MMVNGDATPENVPQYTPEQRDEIVGREVSNFNNVISQMKKEIIKSENGSECHSQGSSSKRVAPYEQESVNDYFKKTLETTISSDNDKFHFFDYDPRTMKYVPNIEAIVHFIHKRLKTVSFNEKIYTYDAEKGVYVQNIGIIHAIINEICRVCEQPQKVITLQSFVIPNLKGLNVYTKYPFDQIPFKVPFSNGTVTLVDGKWKKEPKRPSDFLTWSLEFPYNHAASISPVMDVLESWVGRGEAEKLIDIPALALLQASVPAPYKLNYLLVGPHDAGKSTYIDLLQLFFGRDKCGEVPLQQIGARFTNSQLEGKMINLFDDLSEKEFGNLGAFKKLSGRFFHPIEKKGENTYEGLIRCIHLFSCNKVPVVEVTDDDAFYSRWQPIIFPNQFARNPGWTERTFTPEFLSGFANLILMKYIKILNEGLVSDLSPEEVREFWMKESSPEFSFIMEKLEMGSGYTIPSSECYTLYEKWMTDKKFAPSKIKNPVHFGRALSRMYIKSGSESAAGSRYEVYKGVRLKVDNKEQQ